MKEIILLSISIFLFSYSFSQDKPSKQKKCAIIKFEKKIHNFGKIPENKIAKFTFKFHNYGTIPLIIKHVTASCNCTVPEWDQQPIMPGESGSITTSFNPKGYAGHTFKKAITVFTNARDGKKRNALFYLQITGKVENK